VFVTHGWLKQRARSLKRDIAAVWIASRDPRVPWYAKWLAAGVAAYALSPVDLIPDFIPVLGYCDDLLIVPLGIWIVVSLIPDHLMSEFRAEAARRERRPNSWVGLAGVVLVWLIVGILAGRWLLRHGHPW
jgi:uncharacterized membrane protein YkvA (DUF1232 family)